MNEIKEVSEVTSENLYKWLSRASGGKKDLTINEEVLELIKATIDNPEYDGFNFIDTMITYQNALNGKNVSLLDYVNALRFCGALEYAKGNATEAYIKAFSHRDFVKSKLGCSTTSDEYKMLSSAAGRYRKNPLVVNILTQAEVPLYLMFQGYRYKAVATLVKEMEHAALSKDRIAAADKLLFHLKPPENVKIELDVGLKQDNVVNKYEEMLNDMVKKQRDLLASGASLDEVTNVVDGEIVNE